MSKFDTFYAILGVIILGMLGYAYLLHPLLPQDTEIYVCEYNSDYTDNTVTYSYTVTTTNWIQQMLGQGEGAIRLVTEYGDIRDFDITSADEVLIEAISYNEDDSAVTIRFNTALKTLHSFFLDSEGNKPPSSTGVLFNCELSD